MVPIMSALDSEVLKVIQSKDCPLNSPVYLLLKNLPDVVDLIQGLSSAPNEISQLRKDKSVPYLRYQDIIDGTISDKEMRYIGTNAVRGQENFRTRENDILFSVRGVVGKAAVVTNEYVNCVASSHLVILRPKNILLNSTYLQYVLTSPFFRSQLELIKVGSSGMGGVSIKDLRKIMIPIPSISQQNDIIKKVKQGEKNGKQTSSLEPDKVLVFSLIKEGESNSLEFKSSMRYPIHFPESVLSKQMILKKFPNKENKALEQALLKETMSLVTVLEHEITKTVAAFMNSEGGVLIVGVQDDGSILGLESDFQSFSSRKNWDGWLQHFTNLINTDLGTECLMYIKIKPIDIEEKTVAFVRVLKSNKPIFLEYLDTKGQPRIDFYIRALNTTQTLNIREVTHYINEHWHDNS